MLGLAKFHPTAGLLAASIPWLFCPAAFGGKTKLGRHAWLLAVLPFAAIVIFFQLAQWQHFFPVHAAAKLSSDDIVGLFAPLVMAEYDISNTTTAGFYHVPIAALTMGCAMLLAAKRRGIIALVITGVVLACSNSFWGISSVIWLSIPTVCCSVIIGAGFQGMALAGPADRKWLLAAAFVQATFAITALFLATKYFKYFLSLADNYAKLFEQIARAKMRLTPLRWAILSFTIAIDIVLAANFIVNRIL
jgi:hypothetical protein